jgi:hypothetical protein
VRRLFSTFARGWPGVGLLLIRLAAGCALIAQGGLPWRPDAATGLAALAVLGIVAAVLLIAGLWTPAAGVLVAAVGAAGVALRRGDPLTDLLIGSMGAALALVGPGTWSIDAYLFGWRRVELRDRNSTLKRGADTVD